MGNSIILPPDYVPNKKEEYMNDWDIEDSEYDPDYFCIEIEEV